MLTILDRFQMEGAAVFGDFEDWVERCCWCVVWTVGWVAGGSMAVVAAMVMVQRV